MRIFCIVAVLSLLATPLVFSEDGGQPSSAPPSAGGPAFDFDGDGQVDKPWFPMDRNQISYRVVPNPRGLRMAWTCQAQAGSGSMAADEACDFGRELSRMPPCTRPEDCQALHQWRDQVGSPGVHEALSYRDSSAVIEIRSSSPEELAPEPGEIETAEDEDEP